MQNRRQDPDAIAEEAVGQRRGNPPPEAEKKPPDLSQEELARRLAEPAGAEASIPEKTAESVGERVGDAYSDPGPGVPRNPAGSSGRLNVPRESPRERPFGSGAGDPVFGAARPILQPLSHQLGEQPFMTALACFALGYMTALVLHGRR